MNKWLVVLLMWGSFFHYHLASAAFTPITVTEVQQLQQHHTAFVLYTGRASCPHCRAFAPTLATASTALGVPVYYLDSEHTATDQHLQDFRQTYHIQTVPNLSYFEGTQLISTLPISKDTSYQHIKQFLQTTQ